MPKTSFSSSMARKSTLSGMTCAQFSSFKTCLFDASHFFLQIKVFSVCIIEPESLRIHRNVERSIKYYVDYAQSRKKTKKKICKQTSRLLFLEKFFSINYFSFWLEETPGENLEKTIFV